jgi:hypothetical protein
MPITRAKFVLGEQEEHVQQLFMKVVNLLKENAHLAYSEPELRSGILVGPPSSADTDVLHEVLDYLTYLGVLDRRMVNGSDYYAFLRDIDEL